MPRRALILAALAALPVPAAALTPAELLSVWRSEALSFGLPFFPIIEEREDGSILLKHPNFVTPGSGGPVDDAILFEPRPDGTVGIVTEFQDRGTTVIEENGTETTIALPGFDMVAREVDDRIAYEATARQIAVQVVTGEDTGYGSLTAFEIRDLRVTFDHIPVPGQDWTARIEAAGFGNLTEPMADDGFSPRSWSRTTGDMAVDIGISLPTLQRLADLPQNFESAASFRQALDNGLGLVVGFTSGELTGEAGGSGLLDYTIASRSDPAEGTFSLDAGGLDFHATQGASEATYGSPVLPGGAAALSVGAFEAAASLGWGEADPAFSYRVEASDMALDEAFLAALDPQGRLSHAAGRVAVDVSGRMRDDPLVLIDRLTAMETGGMTEMPAMENPVETVQLNDFEFGLAGFRVTASGALALPPDLSRSPTGAGEARIDGLDAALDIAIDQGWVTAQDVMPVRAGLATVFRAGPDPDSRVTSVELREGGAVYVNGQKMTEF